MSAVTSEQIDQVFVTIDSSNIVRNERTTYRKDITTSHLHSHHQTTKNWIPFFVTAK
jgi:hypothetical protein